MAAPHGLDEDKDGKVVPEDLFISEQLILTDGDDDRLPWLEASDFDEADSRYDNGRMAGFALLVLLLFGLIGAGLWWFNQREVSADLQPEGSVIAAATGPYKVRPDDAGGKTFEGTGDRSFAVGEGQRSESTLGTGPQPAPTPEPTSAPASSSSGEPQAEPAVASSPPSPSGPVVQVGAYASRASAEEGWRTLMRQTDKLNGVKHRVVQGTADIGVVFRLQAVPGDMAAARQLCAALKSDGVACQVKR